MTKTQKNTTFFITYPQSFNQQKEFPLETLNNFIRKYVPTSCTIHILPFYASTSDGGFAVSNFLEVHKSWGTWKEIRKITKKRSVMGDLVLNHVSSKHPCFQKAHSGDSLFEKYFLSYNTHKKFPDAFNPRDKDLLTKFKNKYYWTTFSKDQIDFNFKNPDVISEINTILEHYASKGISHIRLDALCYTSKQKLSSKKHVQEISSIISQLDFKDMQPVAELHFDYDTVTLYKKALASCLTYNFVLPSLLYYTFLTKDFIPFEKYCTTADFKHNFNVLATHDGISAIGAKPFLNQDNLKILEKDVLQKGFDVSRIKQKETVIPYEFNINYLDALGSKDAFLCAHSILFFLQGIPGIYYTSYLGDRGISKKDDFFKVHTYTKRSVNRKEYVYNTIKEMLQQNTHKDIYSTLRHMIEIHAKHKDFNPEVPHSVLIKNNIITISRGSFSAIHNMSDFELIIPKQYDIVTKSFKRSLKP
ncbi:MAG: alpha-amylase family glycosyl hydrolase, partial [Candidatus Woesearchaeota archaeon]